MARAKKSTEPNKSQSSIDVLSAEVAALKEMVAALSAKTVAAPTVAKRDKLVLNGNKTYILEAIDDGLSISRDSETVLLVSKNGQLATGTKSPRTVGKGSAHFRAGTTSEAIIPSAGVGSTRGVIVEGDGDDNKTFVFRAVSRMNRQGVNVFSDGSLSVGWFDKINGSTFGVYHRHNDVDAMSLHVPSKDFDQRLLNIQCNAPLSGRWKAISITADSDEKSCTEIFAVDGTGAVSAYQYAAVSKGYAEYFEWADGNHSNEDRTGYTVTVNKTGKLRVADDGDTVIGVVVNSAAFVGNSAWNTWHKKFESNSVGNHLPHVFSVVEWLENETTELKSYYKDSVRDNFATPENAVEIQSDSNGNNLTTFALNKQWDNSREYSPRSQRNSWALVCLLGTAPVYRGQTVDSRWVKLCNLNDELELQLIK
jgi:hypothetical protein